MAGKQSKKQSYDKRNRRRHPIPYAIEETGEPDGNETDPSNKQPAPSFSPFPVSIGRGEWGRNGWANWIAEQIGDAAVISAVRNRPTETTPVIDGHGTASKQARR